MIEQQQGMNAEIPEKTRPPTLDNQAAARIQTGRKETALRTVAQNRTVFIRGPGELVPTCIITQRASETVWETPKLSRRPGAILSSNERQQQDLTAQLPGPTFPLGLQKMQQQRASETPKLSRKEKRAMKFFSLKKPQQVIPAQLPESTCPLSLQKMQERQQDLARLKESKVQEVEMARTELDEARKGVGCSSFAFRSDAEGDASDLHSAGQTYRDVPASNGFPPDATYPPLSSNLPPEMDPNFPPRTSFPPHQFPPNFAPPAFASDFPPAAASDFPHAGFPPTSSFQSSSSIVANFWPPSGTDETFTDPNYQSNHHQQSWNDLSTELVPKGVSPRRNYERDSPVFYRTPSPESSASKEKYGLPEKRSSRQSPNRRNGHDRDRRRSRDRMSSERRSRDRKSPEGRSRDRKSPERRSRDHKSPERRSRDHKSPERRSRDRRSPERVSSRRSSSRERDRYSRKRKSSKDGSSHRDDRRRSRSRDSERRSPSPKSSRSRGGRIDGKAPVRGVEARVGSDDAVLTALQTLQRQFEEFKKKNK